MKIFSPDFRVRLLVTAVIAVLSFILSGAGFPERGTEQDPCGVAAAGLCAEISEAERPGFERAARSNGLWLLQSMTR